jgi:hypothetical protein
MASPPETMAVTYRAVMLTKKGGPEAGEIAAHASANGRQRFAERRHSRELCSVANRSILRMIPVLLAPACIPPGRLQMPVGGGTDPHILPGGRYHERSDASQRLLVKQLLSAGPQIYKAVASAFPCDAGTFAGDVSQPRDPRRFVWVYW